MNYGANSVNTSEANNNFNPLANCANMIASDTGMLINNNPAQ